MLGGLSATDRRLVILCGAAVVPLVVATAFVQSSPSETRSVVPSTYSTAPGGAQAAYLLLQDLGHPVSRREEPLERLVAWAQLAGPDQVAVEPRGVQVRVGRILERAPPVLLDLGPAPRRHASVGRQAEEGIAGEVGRWPPRGRARELAGEPCLQRRTSHPLRLG